MTLFPLPYYDFSIPISLSAEEGANRLSNAVEHGSLEELEPGPSLKLSPGPPRLRGTVYTHSFRLRRVLDHRNDFAPVAHGEFRERTDGGVEAHVTLIPPVFTILFLLAWFALTGYAAAPGIRKVASGEFSGISDLAPAGMFFFGFALMVVGFWPEVSKTRRSLESALEGGASGAVEVEVRSYTIDQKGILTRFC